MEDEFPSFFIGENTLAAIDVAENTENLKKYCPLKSMLNYGKSTKTEECDNNCLSVHEGKGYTGGKNEQDPKFEEEGLRKCRKPSESVTDSTTSAFSEKISSKEYKCNLEDWNLPSSILKKYFEMGVKTMFHWQAECLSNHFVLSGKNLVYSAPTSAGKTLVAEILAMKTIVERKKKAVIILPFVSVVKEKTNYFQGLLEGNGIRVEGFMGGCSPLGGIQRTDVAICTIEKANSLINRLMEDGSLNVVGIVVVDELHLLGDSNRGYLLELLLTKIRYMCARDNINIQIVGMSATLPNLGLLAIWLEAELYQTDFRPVPLKEFIKFGKVIYDRSMKQVSKVNLSLPIKEDSDDVTSLCVETISQGFSVLIFCPTKNWCEKLAGAIARDFYHLRKTPVSSAIEGREILHSFIAQLNNSSAHEVLERLKSSPVGLDSVLEQIVSLGVAFHHAGLTLDERDILESSFRSGNLRVLVATSTLSSGVNLPARRVIVRTPVFHGQVVDLLTYRQMIGRAGRMGVDTAGESILICQEKERNQVRQLVASDLPPIESCLANGRSSKLSGSLKRAIFEVVASGVACTPKEVENYISFTLLSASMKDDLASNNDLKDPLKSCIKFLEENEFIRLKAMGDGVVKYIPTQLGEACLSASLAPDQAIALFEELQRARKCFVLEDELHIIYQVTPFSVADQWGNNLDWLHVLNIWESLPPSMQRVGELVGIEERFMVRAMRGSINIRAPKQMEKMAIHRRFYTALALQELANEVPLNEVAYKYGCSRGMLQNLQQSSSMFAGMVTMFCRRLGWTGLELLSSQFQDRLQFGIRRELCDLMRLSMLDVQCARALYEAGIENLAMLAADTTPEQIEESLRGTIPFESEKREDLKNKIRGKWTSAWGNLRNLLGNNAAKTLIEEARRMLQKELGVAEMKWKSHQDQDKDLKDIEKVEESNSIQMMLEIQSPQVDSLKDGKVEKSENVSAANLLSNVSIVSRRSEELIFDECIPESDSSGIEKSFTEVYEPVVSNNTSVKSLNHPHPIKSKVSSDREFSNVDKHNGSSDKNYSNLASKDCSVDAPSTPSASNIVLNNSGRVNSFTNKTQRVSLDMFSSPVNEEMLASSSSNRSPSLFGDSFTVDTQLGSLLDGSSGSNRSMPNHVTHSDKTSAQKSSSQNFSPITSDHNSKSSFTNQSTPLGILRPSSQSFEKKKFNKKHSLLSSSPRNESLEICSVEDTALSKWDFGSAVQLEICDDSLAFVDSSSIESNIKVDEKEVDSYNMKDEKVESNVRNIGLNEKDGSFLGKAFTTVFDFDENFTVRVEDIESEVEKKEATAEGKNNISNDNRVDEEEGWGSHLHNCSLEAIHHSINAISYSDENDDILASSQGDEFDRCQKTDFILTARKNNVNITKCSILKSLCENRTPSNVCDKVDGEVCDISTSKSVNISKLKNWTNCLDFRVLPEISKCGFLCLNIVDVCKDLDLFKVFCEELELQEVISFSMATSHSRNPFIKSNSEEKQIGAIEIGNVNVGSPAKRKHCDIEIDRVDLNIRGIGSLLNGSTKVDGISFSWGRNTVYFMSLLPENDVEMKSMPSYYEKVALLKKIFEPNKLVDRTLVAFDLKEHLKALIVGFNVCPVRNCRYWDPKIADWLLNPGGYVKNLRTMCLGYCPQLWKLLKACGGDQIVRGSWALGFAEECALSSRICSAINAFAALYCMSSLEKILLKEDMFKTFEEFEMPAAFCLAQMEALGIGFSETEAENIKSLLLSNLRDLEKRAFQLAGRRFNISSPAEVGKVLYRELRLPFKNSRNTPNSANKKKWSTCKQSLEKLSSVHQLPRILLEWRKINSILNKTVNPLVRSCQENRIYGVYVIQTATGRISMREPNLQNVPRNFEILSSGGGTTSNLQDKGISQKETYLSIRNSFIPAEGFIFLSADYSQLELRIIAHLSKDEKLCSVLNRGCDVFTTIASLWKNVDAEKVIPELRQQVKKICYGIIYGIGCKSLAQQLEVEENEASDFMETFKNSFPGLKAFLISTVEQCRANGYIRTMRGRKRELPAINSSNPAQKAQAERQAVNSIVQGSAADLVKAAMVGVERRLRKRFPPLGYTSAYHVPKFTSNFEVKRQKFDDESQNEMYGNAGAILVLNLHDELIYEVAEHDLETVASIVQSEMEAAWKISVALPVNLKIGKSWGDLHDFVPRSL